jgi:hypothetical protein
MKLAWTPGMRRLALWTGGLLALYALAGFLVAPPLARSQLEQALSEQLGRSVGIGSVRLNPFTLKASVRDFSLKEQDGGTTAVGFEDLSVNLTLSSLFRLGIIVEAVDLTRPYVRVARLSDGRYSFQDIVDRLASAPPAPPGPAPRFAVYNIQLRDGRIEFDDRPGKTQHAVTDLHIGLPFISSMPAEIDIVVAPRLNARVNGTPFEIVGETRPFKDQSVTTVRIDIDDLELAKYLEYVPLRVRVPSGKLNTRLVLSSAAVPGNRLQTLLVSGTASLEGLKVRHADGAPLFALARLSVDLSGLDLLQQRAIVTGLRIDGPEIDIVRRKDGSLDLPAALRRGAAGDEKASSERPFTFMIEQLALSNGRVRFVDRTPEKPVTVALSELSLYVESLGNTGESSAAVKMRARLGRAPLDAAGKLALLPQGLAFDLKVNARAIELTPLSPYSVMYAGHAIDKGKLSLKHAWVVKDRKLTAQNNVYLDQFTLGEKVESPTATSLPVALAVSLLKDKNGIIDLNVPLSGTLDDPQVSIGEVIASAFRSPLDKAASSPFALLGAQFGAGEELAYLEFPAGSAALDAHSRAKLKTLATALSERPGLQLDISGRVDPKTDGAELKKASPKSTDAQTEAELRKLADARAGAARLWLVESGKLSAERVSVVQPGIGNENIKDSGKPTRVDFALR